jgi:hypothetical protein
MLLLGGNVEGDIKLKPLLIYHTQNPRALKGQNKASLPVTWQSNKKAWVTIPVFSDYITSYLSPFIASYCAKNNLDNKCLSIIDNAPGHPINVEDYTSNIKVVFLPPNTTSILQPMDQGVIATFKTYYLQLVMRYLVSESDGESKPTVLQELWKKYNIKMAIDNTALAWDRVTQKNDVWKALLPKSLHDFTNFNKTMEGIQEKIVKLAVEAGFEAVDKEDIQEVLNSHKEKLLNEEFIQLDKDIKK